jgi:putative FmdB family regulatory protein
MPLYEYSCNRCGKRFEVLQKFSDEPLKVHENCGGEVERLLSAPALQFKGTGWYVTDYAKSGTPAPANGDGAKKDSKGDAKADSSASASAPPKTETKPASESKPV